MQLSAIVKVLSVVLVVCVVAKRLQLLRGFYVKVAKYLSVWPVKFEDEIRSCLFDWRSIYSGVVFTRT